MKKVISTIIICVLFLVILNFISPAAKSGSESNNTLFVGGDENGNFLTIQEAVDSANDGDIIFVYAGTYNGSITIDKSLSLIGEDKNTTIIDSHTFGDVLTVTKDWVNISDFTIQNGQKTDWIEGGYAYINSGIRILSGHVTVDQNVIVNNTYGIYIENGENNQIISNHIFDNGKGIRISGFNNTIANNNISNNNQNYTTNITLMGENNFGIYLVAANDNNITGNTISNHLGKGIKLSLLSLNNTIYKNNFIDNAVNAFDDSNNSWDNGKFGNYWSDYTGKDKNEDKIGDTPYLIPGGDNKDNHPLMEPYKEFTVDEESMRFMLILGTILAIIFVIPIAYYWYKNFHKKID